MSIWAFLIRLIDRFYFPFIRSILPLQTFRYAVCGGMNMLLDMILYFGIFHVVVRADLVVLWGGDLVISPEVAAFLITFPITFFTGLWLGRNISFQHSVLRHRTQLFRYLLVVLMNILMKYYGLKLFVGVFRVFPSIANAILTLLSVIFSYFMQKYFTFKGNKSI